jgi:hypothetical protein
VRSVTIGTGPLSFATAAAGSRALLALSTPSNAAVLIVTGEGSLVRNDPALEPSTTVVAAGVDEWLLLHALPTRESPHPARIALFPADRPGRVLAVDDPSARSLGDPRCARGPSGVRCALSWTSGPLERPTTTLTTLVADGTLAPRLESTHTIEGEASASALSANPPSWLLASAGRLLRVDAAGRASRVTGEPLELATVGGMTLGLWATAPSRARCQPGAWRLALRTEPADAGAPSPIGSADARPIGVRIRETGASGGVALASWVEAPQCSETLSILRVFRVGTTVSIARATVYDIAADRALLSIAWRDGDRLRWARYRCRA